LNSVNTLIYKKEDVLNGNLFSLLFLFFLLISTNSLKAQLNQQDDQPSQIVRFNGSLNLSSEFYNANGITNRLPANTERMIFRSNVSLFDQIQLPFEVYWTSQQAQFQQPFSQFGINPLITSWLQLHAGYFSTQISDFTFGDVRVLGAGVDFHPGNFRLKILYGRSHDAVDPDTLQNYYGSYKQMVFSAQLGYGDESISFVNINLFHAKDDTNSINRNSLTPAANENLVTSLGFGVKVIDELSFNGEGALSLFSNDITAHTLSTTKVKLPQFLFTLRNSSQVDGAARLSMSLTPSKYWGLRLGARWIGPGFVTLGYSQLQNDLLEYSVIPYLRILNGKLNIRCSIGIKDNNLRNNRAYTTGRFSGSFSADYQVTAQYGFNIQYNNNQVKSARSNDTLKISNVFNSVTLAPRYSFGEFGGSNNLVLNYSYQNSIDKIPFLLSSTQNKTNMVNLMHTLSLPSTLNFVTSLLVNSVVNPVANIKMYNITETAGHMFLDNLLTTAVSLGYGITKATSQSNLILVKLIAVYSLGKWGSLNLNLSNNHINSGDNISPTYSELQGILQYDINF
jgi:hypothetical protein